MLRQEICMQYKQRKQQHKQQTGLRGGGREGDGGPGTSYPRDKCMKVGMQ